MNVLHLPTKLKKKREQQEVVEAKEKDAAKEKEAVKEKDKEKEAAKEKEAIEPALVERSEKIRRARLNTNTAQSKCAEKMVNRNKKKINSFKVGDYVLLHSEDVDRGKADPCNILCIIMEKKDEFFKLGCKVGVLNDYFAINSFEKTDLINYFNINDIPAKSKKSRFL